MLLPFSCRAKLTVLTVCGSWLPCSRRSGSVWLIVVLRVCLTVWPPLIKLVAMSCAWLCCSNSFCPFFNYACALFPVPRLRTLPISSALLLDAPPSITSTYSHKFAVPLLSGGPHCHHLKMSLSPSSRFHPIQKTASLTCQCSGPVRIAI